MGPTAPVCNYSCILCASGRGWSSVSFLSVSLRKLFPKREQKNPQLVFVDETLSCVLLGGRKKKSLILDVLKCLQHASLQLPGMGTWWLFPPQYRERKEELGSAATFARLSPGDPMGYLLRGPFCPGKGHSLIFTESSSWAEEEAGLLLFQAICSRFGLAPPGLSESLHLPKKQLFVTHWEP